MSSPIAINPGQQRHLRSTTSISSAVGKTRFEWIISDFGAALVAVEGAVLKSSPFDVVADANNSITLQLGCKKSKDSDDLGFGIVKVSGIELKVDISLAFLKADGVTRWGRRGPRRTPLTHNNRFFVGFSKMVSLEKLREELLLLPDGKLTVICDLTVKFGDGVHHTPVESVILPLVFPHLSPTISSGLSSLLISGERTDVTIKCGDKTFECHQLVLAARSDVFKAMFKDDFTESKTKVVVIKDIEENILAKLIQAFYADSFCNLDLDDQSCLKLLQAADFYNFESFKIFCEETLAKEVDVENVACMLSWAIKCKAQNLENLARKFLEFNLMKVVKTSGFADLMKVYPEALKEESNNDNDGSTSESAAKRARLDV